MTRKGKVTELASKDQKVVVEGGWCLRRAIKSAGQLPSRWTSWIFGNGRLAYVDAVMVNRMWNSQHNGLAKEVAKILQFGDFFFLLSFFFVTMNLSAFGHYEFSTWNIYARLSTICLNSISIFILHMQIYH